ncbi:MAG: zf-HC2 domain-containing protein [Planctomycetota bacterium]|nr:zf-HC2 domain-containing protein [Planctomycetota bacterium]
MDGTCHKLEENIPAFIYGDLPGEERDLLTEHIDSCPRCAETLREFRSVREMLDASPVPPTPEPGAIAARVMARAHVRRLPSPAWSPVRWAALILIGIALGFGITNYLVPAGVDLEDVEAMAESGVGNPQMESLALKMGGQRYGIKIKKYEDSIEPVLNKEKVVIFTENLRQLTDLASGESQILAGFFQLKIGDFYEEKMKNPDRAMKEYLKVFDYVQEGRIFDFARDRVDHLRMAEPEEK